MTKLVLQKDITSILNQLKHYLKAQYKEDLFQVILFGSQARDDPKSDSDIDILIVLKTPFSYYQEVQRISPFISDICLESNQLITCCFATFQQWKTENTAFYRNIRKEGIIL